MFDLQVVPTNNYSSVTPKAVNNSLVIQDSSRIALLTRISISNTCGEYKNEVCLGMIHFTQHIMTCQGTVSRSEATFSIRSNHAIFWQK